MALNTLGSLLFPSRATPRALLARAVGVPPELFKDTVQPEFFCGMCNDVLCLPIQTSCGCRFCYGCLYRDIRDKEGELKCPACEDTFDTSQIVPDHYSERQLGEAIVFCPNKDRGCQKETNLKNLDRHLEGCLFLHKAPGSTTIVLRENSAKHGYVADLELSDMKKKVNEIIATLESAGDGKKKSLQNQLEEALAAMEKLEKIMQCLQGELDDANVDLVRKRAAVTSLEKKQKTFDAILAEEKGEKERLQAERDNLKRELHNKETKVISLNRELEDLQDQLAESERIRKEQTAELEDHLSNKDDVGKNDTMDEQLEGGAVAGVGGRGGRAGNEVLQGNGREVAINSRITSIENQMEMLAEHLSGLDLRLYYSETANYEGDLLWKINDFSLRKQDADSGRRSRLTSQPFYTGRRGYKMVAVIHLNGLGVGHGTHVSLFLALVHGEHDALLQWPFRPSKVTLMLLDQETGRRNLWDSFRPDPNTSSFQRPTTEHEMNVPCGSPIFVNQNVLKDTAYLKDDVIFVEVIVD